MEEFVYIIESPSDEDLLDGRTEGRVLAEALDLAGIDYSYSLVTTEKSLEIALYERLAEAINSHNKSPILHFSGHGNSQSLGLTDHTTLPWDELGNLLLPIKQELGELLICMFSCHGSFTKEMAKQKYR